jgi:hypothetical protein
MRTVEQVCISLPKEILAKIENSKGTETFSAYVRNVLVEHFEKVA